MMRLNRSPDISVEHAPLQRQRGQPSLIVESIDLFEKLSCDDESILPAMNSRNGHIQPVANRSKSEAKLKLRRNSSIVECCLHFSQQNGRSSAMQSAIRSCVV